MENKVNDKQHQLIVKVEEGQELPFASVSEREFINMEDEDKYFSGHEL